MHINLMAMYQLVLAGQWANLRVIEPFQRAAPPQLLAPPDPS